MMHTQLSGTLGYSGAYSRNLRLRMDRWTGKLWFGPAERISNTWQGKLLPIYLNNPPMTRAHYEAALRFIQRYYAGRDRVVNVNNEKVSQRPWTETYQIVHNLYRDTYLLGDIRYDDYPVVTYTDPLRAVYADGQHARGYVDYHSPQGIFAWTGVDDDTYEDDTPRLRKRTGQFYYSIGIDKNPPRKADHHWDDNLTLSVERRGRIQETVKDILPDLLDGILAPQGITLVDVAEWQQPYNRRTGLNTNPPLTNMRHRREELDDFIKDNKLDVGTWSRLEKLYVDYSIHAPAWVLADIQDQMAKVGVQPVCVNHASAPATPLAGCVAVSLPNDTIIYPEVWPYDYDGEATLYVLPSDAGAHLHARLQTDTATRYEASRLSRDTHERLLLDDHLWLLSMNDAGGWSEDRVTSYPDLNNRVMEVRFRDNIHT